MVPSGDQDTLAPAMPYSEVRAAGNMGLVDARERTMGARRAEGQVGRRGSSDAGFGAALCSQSLPSVDRRKPGHLVHCQCTTLRALQTAAMRAVGRPRQAAPWGKWGSMGRL